MNFITITYLPGEVSNEGTLDFIISKAIKNYAKTFVVNHYGSGYNLMDMDVVHRIGCDNEEEVYSTVKGSKELFCKIASVKRTERFITITTNYFRDEEYIKSNPTLNSICLN